MRESEKRLASDKNAHLKKWKTSFVTSSWISFLPTETIIECTAATAPKLFTKLHKKIFAGNLLLIAKHSVGNFVAQRFFENVQSAELFTR